MAASFYFYMLSENIFNLISCDCVFKLCLNIPKHYESAIYAWDMWLLSYFDKNLKYMFVEMDDKYAFHMGLNSKPF